MTLGCSARRLRELKRAALKRRYGTPRIWPNTLLEKCIDLIPLKDNCRAGLTSRSVRRITVALPIGLRDQAPWAA